MNDIEKLIGDLIDHETLAFIGSIDDEGYPNIKAMLAPRKREKLKIFYFTTTSSSIKMDHYKENPKSSIYFCNHNSFTGIMFKGKMEILTDYETKKMIWREGDQEYFLRGIDDPDFSVLKFTAESGRYYSNFKSESFEID
ncbi:pyridoxamine 5'-phosphate oxidase family protein [Apibacter raozihei]|uniref:pyridoxamine 5'-phosphate oxidase family protein n=1 Tax=Apibacter raozihei TaxID=2500547 RepID=UPI000FE30616|nr:pyridoxamine 5'-phosphate oxidase family protein [Apibacter raozihei]